MGCNDLLRIEGFKMNDLTWLARNVHEWPTKESGRFVSGHKYYGQHHTGVVDCKSGTTEQQWLAERERLQNKPSWDDAPEWAKSLGQDADGEWNWLPHYDPTDLDDNEWMIENSNSTKTKLATKGEVLGDWRDTLEKRPEQMTPPTHTNHRCVQVNIENQEWDREGLPPVWVRIEAIGEHNTEWFELEIVAMRDGNAWIIDYSNGLKRDYIICLDSYKFRPLKTEEEKAVEDMERIYRSEPSNTSVQDGMRALYRAGYRKP